MSRKPRPYNPTEAMLHHLGQRLLALRIELGQAIRGAPEPAHRGLGATFRLGHSPMDHIGDPNPQNIAGFVDIANIRDAICDVERQISRITVGPFVERGLGHGFQMGRSPMGAPGPGMYPAGTAQPGIFPARTIADDLDDFRVGDSEIGG
jgi:hypothetical protein